LNSYNLQILTSHVCLGINYTHNLWIEAINTYFYSFVALITRFPYI